MKITCTGRKVNLKDAFMQRVETKLAKLDKFFSDSAEANVTVTVEKEGFTSRAEKSADRMEDAFDAAVDLLTRRIVKNRKRLENRVYQPAVEEFALAAHEAEPEEAYSIIREKRFSCKPSTVDEAILEMNMLGHTFFLFRDADTDEIHAVYRRTDGSYGVLIPER